MKPKIVIVADMINWAWAYKGRQLARHLGDQFALQVVHLLDRHKPDPLPPAADLYSTFEIFMVRHLRPGMPYVTGMTAHVLPGHLKANGEQQVRRWCDEALAFHANSKLLEREMQAFLQRPIAYVPNGVDETFFRRTRARSSNGRLVVGHVGKPNPRKGEAIIARACKLAGAEYRKIQETHRTALPPEKMREFYQDLHVLAVASDMDGTPNPALEAAACGVAVVSSRIGNMPEFIAPGMNGKLIDMHTPVADNVERNAELLAAELRALDVRSAVRMGEAARVTVEAGWTWAHMAPNYARLWLGALEARKVAA